MFEMSSSANLTLINIGCKAVNEPKLVPLLNQTDLERDEEEDRKSYLQLLDDLRLDKKLNVVSTDRSDTGYRICQLNRIDNVQTEKIFK